MEEHTIPGTPRFALWRAMIGDHDDAEQHRQMESVSPSQNLDRIKAPLLLLHGTYDSMVSAEQSEGFARRAKSADVDVAYVELRAGTHFLDDSANRLTAFKAIDEFLAQHLRQE
jgi:dipeptidyl aminopeptidase/acylaminoacyl peptidase